MRLPTHPATSEVPSSATSAPRTVVNAARFMYAGAAISAVLAVIDAVTLLSSHERATLVQQHPHWTTSQVHAAIASAFVFLIVAQLVEIALWIVMARVSLAGRNWGRIASSVLFGLGTANIAAGVAHARTAALIPSLLVWVAGAGAVILLWQRESTDYFRSG